MADATPSDAELARLAGSGDVEALAGLLDRYRPSLYAAAIGLLRNRDDAGDAVQDTCATAIVRLGSLRDPGSVGGWLHAVLRNTCLMRLRRSGREAPTPWIEPPDVVPGVDEVIDGYVLREWLWSSLGALGADDRATVMLRYFTRCSSYRSIAQITGVPVGTVRSRLNRARLLLREALMRTLTNSPLSHADLEQTQRAAWEQFYAELHEAPVPATYADRFASDVDVSDGIGRWQGISDWSAHERGAILLGVRANVVGVLASDDITILEIDFTNPPNARDHCPARSTFVHRIAADRSRRLDIHYV